jgi:coniferyl-aldehyde dehydrogenase
MIAKDTPLSAPPMIEGTELKDVQSHMVSLLTAQRAAFMQEMPVPAEIREHRVDRLLVLVLKHAEEFAEAMRLDYGHRSPMLSLVTDVHGILPSLKHTRSRVRAWMKPTRVSSGALRWIGGRAWIQWQPLGIIGIISPWNFPLALAVQPLAQALAAGNRAMIKTSEVTPHTSDLLARRIADYFDPLEVAVITGGPEIGAAFSALPFDHLFFTGAPSVARHVQRAAAANLVPVTLELGGKSPVVIGPDADFARAARSVAIGKTINVGQLCLTPDYVYVPAGREREFAAALQASFAKLFPTLRDNADYSAIVAPRHYARLQSYLDDARRKGATLIEVNPAGEDFSGQPHRKIPPTLLLEVTSEMKVMQEELFGPLLPILGYRDIDEVITGVNSRPRPLATYYFGSPTSAACRRYLDRMHSGGAVINDVLLHAMVEDLPFGGVGESGMGAYHGRAGFETLSHARAVVKAPRLSPLMLMAPPYTRLERLMGWLRARELRAVESRLGEQVIRPRVGTTRG